MGRQDAAGGRSRIALRFDFLVPPDSPREELYGSRRTPADRAPRCRTARPAAIPFPQMVKRVRPGEPDVARPVRFRIGPRAVQRVSEMSTASTSKPRKLPRAAQILPYRCKASRTLRPRANRGQKAMVRLLGSKKMPGLLPFSKIDPERIPFSSITVSSRSGPCEKRNGTAAGPSRVRIGSSSARIRVSGCSNRTSSSRDGLLPALIPSACTCRTMTGPQPVRYGRGQSVRLSEQQPDSIGIRPAERFTVRDGPANTLRMNPHRSGRHDRTAAGR
jgi:hypothetical protein